ncbi:MAG: hypothetical protein JEZ09_21460 [Salinivirgaceae bacterium]|nr:hypothetical protein [Salinivirgaceae bacterium]
MKITKIFPVIFILLCSFSSFTQEKNSELKQTIKSSKANNIKALIHISGGRLFVNDETSELADVNFSYNKEDWDPTVSYAEKDNFGKLTIVAKINSKEHNIDDDNICKIALDKKKNYSLGLVLGLGEASINLKNYNIKKALFRLGVGTFDVNLANTSIPLLKVEAGIGEAKFDLSGNWKNDLTAIINAGIGEITLYVPDDVGVKLIVSGFLGSVDTPGYNKQGKEHSNKLYGKAKHNLEFTIKGAIGNINVVEK